jgi:hypothetical protein
LVLSGGLVNIPANASIIDSITVSTYCQAFFKFFFIFRPPIWLFTVNFSKMFCNLAENRLFCVFLATAFADYAGLFLPRKGTNRLKKIKDTD